LRGKGSVELSRFVSGAPAIEFPSPCGERVLLNLSFIVHYNIVDIDMFPSPCGERVLLNVISRLELYLTNLL